MNFEFDSAHGKYGVRIGLQLFLKKNQKLLRLENKHYSAGSDKGFLFPHVVSANLSLGRVNATMRKKHR